MLPQAAIIRQMNEGVTAGLEVRSETLEDWHWRTSPRARRMSARVHLDGRVEIVLPRGASAEAVEAFVARHRRWIEARVAERRALAPAPFPPREVELPAFGQHWRLHLAGGRGGPRATALGNGLLSLRGSGDRASMAAALREWLKAQCREPMGARVAELAAQHGFSYRAVHLRCQRTRWGSCSRRGVISLNVCAAFQPAPVLDYLLLHELAHTRHMNHSPVYWQTVESVCPGWRALDRELTGGWRHVPSWLFA
jgi:predicted metal-dependent hydrolase